MNDLLEAQVVISRSTSRVLRVDRCDGRDVGTASGLANESEQALCRGFARGMQLPSREEVVRIVNERAAQRKRLGGSRALAARGNRARFGQNRERAHEDEFR